MSCKLGVAISTSRELHIGVCLFLFIYLFLIKKLNMRDAFQSCDVMYVMYVILPLCDGECNVYLLVSRKFEVGHKYIYQDGKEME